MKLLSDLLPCLAYFLFVGLLSLQSLLLNQGHTRWAFLISFTVGILQLFAMKKVVVSSDWLIVAVAFSGALGLHTASKLFWNWRIKDGLRNQR